MAKYLELTIEGHTANIKLTRSDVRNALNQEMINDMIQVIDQCDKNQSIRSVILSSVGDSFCAGADLNWMKKSIHFTSDENQADAKQLALLLHTLNTLNKPTICLVQGPAIGGGVGLAVCCDMIIASPEALFCFSEVKLGLIPAIIAPYCIQALGFRVARRYFMSAEIIHAEKALSLHLVDEIVPRTTLLEQGFSLAEKINKNAPEAVAAIKKLCRFADFSETIHDVTIEAIARIRVGTEAQEGMAAFFEKRSPKWQEE